jgi:putative ABC transport system permease protein
VVIILAVVANTMVMTTRERTGEYAVFKCLGFGGRHITAIILGESLVITLTGYLLGVVLTYPTANLMQQQLSNYLPVFFVEPETLLTGLGAALLVAFGAAVIPSHRAVRVRIAESLARVG